MVIIKPTDKNSLNYKVSEIYMDFVRKVPLNFVPLTNFTFA